MNDNIEIGHLSKFDGFWLNRDQVTDLKTSLKIHIILRLRPPTPYKLFKKNYQIWDNWKILSWTFYLEIGEVKITVFAYFYEYYRNRKKNIASLYGLNGDTASKLETFVWIFDFF